MKFRLTATFAFLTLALSACAENTTPIVHPTDVGGTEDTGDTDIGGGDDTGNGENPNVPCATLTLTEAEQRIYDNIMTERAAVGQPSIPLSPSLMKVARAHATDSANHYASLPDTCNLHSWSDQGDWEACCYTSNHANAACMWSKPKEVSNFDAQGYEISAWGTPTLQNAVAGWMNSPPHKAVLLNEGDMWSRAPFLSIGIGLDGNEEAGQFAHVWFAWKSECP